MAMKVYSDLSVGDTAVAIFKDIVYDGVSSGWEPADVVGISQVKKYLEPYNIHYAGDGVWRYEAPEKEGGFPKFSVGQRVYCNGLFGDVNRCTVDMIVIRREGTVYRLDDGTTLTEEDLYADAGPVYDEKIREVKSKIEGLEKECKILEDAKKEALEAANHEDSLERD